jgi:8-oxo-dGTP pyrophosphatase MutT (NUDIX family)
MNLSSNLDRGDSLLPKNATPLTPADAAVALLTLADGRYILQERDPKPWIFYPEHWGLFGGAIEEGETPEQGLVRELEEELQLKIDCDRLTYFTQLSYDLTQLSGPVLRRWFYQVTVSDSEWATAVLGEGRAVGAFDLRDAFRDLRIVPYDEFALWLHGSQERLVFEPPVL